MGLTVYSRTLPPEYLSIIKEALFDNINEYLWTRIIDHDIKCREWLDCLIQRLLDGLLLAQSDRLTRELFGLYSDWIFYFIQWLVGFDTNSSETPREVFWSMC